MGRDVRWPLRAAEGQAGKLTLAVVALWTLVGVAMGVLRVSLAHDTTHAARMIAVAIVAHWFWVPVTLLAAAMLERWPWMTGRRHHALAVHVTLLLLTVVLAPAWLNVVVDMVGGRPNPFMPLMLGQSDTNAVLYALVVATLLAVASYRASIEADVAAVRLEGALSDVQAQVLTMQLQPHFLFNALHAVSETVFEDAGAARRMLADLRALLSESFLFAARREVTVADELRFLESYVAIQRRRFRERLRVDVHVPGETLDALVPHLLLQPLVENAIRHGLASRARGGLVRVELHRDREQLVLLVSDDGVGLKRTANARSETNGLGLTHTQQRLTALYGDQASLTLRDLSGNGAEARVVLPWHIAVKQTSPMPDAAPPLPSPHRPHAPRHWPWAARWAALILAWILVAVLWAQLGAVSNSFTDAPGPSFSGMLRSYLTITGVAATLSFPVFRLMQALPLARARPGRLLAHLLLAIAVGITHGVITLFVLHLVAPYAPYAATFEPLMRESLSGWIVWDSLVYGVALAIANRRLFSQWHRARQLEAASTYANISRANVDLMRLRLQPAVLLAGIDAVSREAAVDPARCEEMIAQLGDLLRRMLGGATIDLALLEHELRSVA